MIYEKGPWGAIKIESGCKEFNFLIIWKKEEF